MDYRKLAERFLQTGYSRARCGPRPPIDQSMRGENFVLFFLSQNAGSVSPSDISAAMNVSTARIAAALNVLENKGLITRSINPDDRRHIQVSLTQQGRDEAEQRRQDGLTRTVRLLEFLGEHDAKELVRIWGRLMDAGHILRDAD